MWIILSFRYFLIIKGNIDFQYLKAIRKESVIKKIANKMKYYYLNLDKLKLLIKKKQKKKGKE